MRSTALFGSLAALAAAQSSSDYSDFTPILQLVSKGSWQMSAVGASLLGKQQGEQADHTGLSSSLPLRAVEQRGL
jgi:hypothetical protein